MGSFVDKFACTKDKLILPLHNGEIKVYDAQDYELRQTIATGGGEVRKIAPTPNSQMFTAGKSNGLVQVYKHDGNQYERVQEFDAGMYIYSLLLN